MTAGAVGFVSTRGSGQRPVTFADALRLGLAPDGGLFVPTRVPSLAPDWVDLERWGDVVDAVLRPWFDPGDADEWVDDARAALDFELPVRPLDADTALLELHHGPTLAFKDVAARTMGRWLARCLRRRGETATVLVATSGDTGGAVADGFAGIDGLRVVVLYPAGRVSPVQERQLTQPREGVAALAVEGDFDACQRLAKRALVDPALARLRLTSANSINVGRLLPQATYHVWGVLRWARACDVRPHDVWSVVPSGNLGNLCAALLAAAMGAAPRGLVAAHNANDHFPRVLRDEVAPGDAPATVATVSNAMDVGAPSNLERIVAMFGTGAYPAKVEGVSVDDEATVAAIRRCWHDHAALVCPHTAVGLEALTRLRRRSQDALTGPALVVATAHPAKFPEVMARALPGVAVTHPSLEALPEAHPAASIAAEADALREWLLAAP